MLKLVYCFRKRPGMSDAEFARYFREVHAPIGARIPGLRRLVQSLAVGDPLASLDSGPPDFDAMAELWFDDWESLAAARGSAEWAASIADEVNFIDHEHVACFVSEERAVTGPAR